MEKELDLILDHGGNQHSSAYFSYTGSGNSHPPGAQALTHWGTPPPGPGLRVAKALSKTVRCLDEKFPCGGERGGLVVRRAALPIHVVLSGCLDAAGLGPVTLITHNNHCRFLKRVLKVACLIKYFTPLPKLIISPLFFP